MSMNPPGWYPDPLGRADVRWWSGTAWTEHVGRGGQSFTDPPVGGTPTPTQGGASPMPAAAPGAPPAVGVVPAAVSTVGATAAPTKKLAIVGVVALIAGGVIGYVARGGSSGSTSTGGGKAAGSLVTPILQGLASLDGYELEYSALTVGPTAGESTKLEGVAKFDKATGNRYTKSVNTSTSADSSSPSASTTESWRTGKLTCSFDGESYSAKEPSPFESDAGSVLSGLLDITIPTGNAVLKGTEKVAGVDANHYTFTVKGLAAGTGAQVQENTGELWVAKDGGYVLRYDVKVSMTSGPAGAAGTEVSTMQLHVEMKSVNQKVAIDLPAGCPTSATSTTIAPPTS
jgi:hypothetical protein